jgi:type IV pilus assembly protein PilF
MAALEFESCHDLEARAFVERWLALAPDDAAGLSLAAQTEQKIGDNVAASRYRSRLQAISSGSNAVPRTQGHRPFNPTRPTRRSQAAARDCARRARRRG